MLGRVQRGLEVLYRIDTELDVEEFLVDEQQRQRAGVARLAREQLLVCEEEDGLAMGLFVDERALERVRSREPHQLVNGRHLEDFLLVVEGVSHFVYLAWRARADRAVCALELELQAEVDKYITCLLSSTSCSKASRRFRRRLFENVEYADDLDVEESDRYRVANDSAHRYSASLERRFVDGGRICEMLGELRRFYRMPLGGKLEHIERAA